jgi:hypothetical protein
MTLGLLTAALPWAPAGGGRAFAQQISDPDFRPEVAEPAFTTGPRMLIDQAHRNFHTAEGRYAPFAALMQADGWNIGLGIAPFSAATLKDFNLLVIANAGEDGEPAFTPDECAAVEEWVRGGGSLWLIADHAPFGAAARAMAQAFGFDMGNGWVYRPDGSGVTTQMDFEPGFGLEPFHPITRGRSRTERVGLVRGFTGQSLTRPEGAMEVLILPPGAREASSPAELDTAAAEMRAGMPLSAPMLMDRCQGFALEHGQGRLLALGEAAMLSAQILIQADGTEIPAGMNVPELDNMQFALNAARWLGRAI